MPQEQLRKAVDALRARLQQELDTQFAALTEQHETAIDAARRSAESDAERRWTAQLEGVKSEWMSRLQSELTSARADADRRLSLEIARLRTEAEHAAADAAVRARTQAERAAAEAAARARAEAEQAAAAGAVRLRAEADQAAAEVIARVRLEAEQTPAEVTARVRAEAEQAAALAVVRVREEADEEIEAERQRGIALLDAERERSSADLDAERQRAASLLDAERQRLESERLAERQRADADRLSERQRFDMERQQFRAERQRFEAERQQLVMERDRLLAEAQQRVAGPDPSAQLHEDVVRLQSELTAEREQLQLLNDELRQAHDAVRRVEAALLEEQQARADENAARALPAQSEPDSVSLVEARAAEREAQLVTVERLFSAMRAMDAATSLTDVLARLVEAAAAEASRAALFIVRGEHLQGHKAVGFPDPIALQRLPATGAGMLAHAIERREAVASSDDSGVEPPEFAGVPPGRAAIALPIAIGGEPVAILYADDSTGDQIAPASWPEAVQILGSHAASCLAHLTATRTAQAKRLVDSASVSTDESSAKRYARLLVSEIKLYNEAAVRVGRENGDLLGRLRAEIERARKLYEERVPDGTGPQQSYFQQELVQTLADGNAALLGKPV